MYTELSYAHFTLILGKYCQFIFQCYERVIDNVNKITRNDFLDLCLLVVFKAPSRWAMI